MLPNKITKNFKEISKFFVENFDISASAIFTVLDMLKLSDKNLCLSTNYNAKYSQTVKFILILLMPFFRIRNVLNYCKSIFYSKMTVAKIPCIVSNGIILSASGSPKRASGA